MKTISLKVMDDIKMGDTILSANVSVSLLDAKNREIINKFETGNGLFYKINMNPKLVLKISKKGVDWTPGQQVYIGRRYIYRFQTCITNFYKYIQNCNNYIYDDNGYLNNVVKDDKDVMFIDVGNQWISFEPDILYVNEIKLPGILITINDPANMIIVSIDEYEEICTCLSHIDINLIGSNLMVMYGQITTDKMVVNEGVIEKPKSVGPKRDIFDRGGEEFVVGPIMRNDIKTLDDL